MNDILNSIILVYSCHLVMIEDSIGCGKKIKKWSQYNNHTSVYKSRGILLLRKNINYELPLIFQKKVLKKK